MPDLPGPHQKAIVAALLKFEPAVAGNVQWVYGRQISRMDEKHPGDRDRAFDRAVESDEQLLLLLRELAGPFERDLDAAQLHSRSLNHIEIAGAWGTLELFYRDCGDEIRAQICHERYQREYQLVAEQDRHHLDEHRADTLADIAERGFVPH